MAHFVMGQISVGNTGSFQVIFGTGTRLLVDASKFHEKNLVYLQLRDIYSLTGFVCLFVCLFLCFGG
jgi:hypothetical protein